MSADQQESTDKAVDEVKEAAEDKVKEVTPEEATDLLKKKPAKSG